MPWGLIDVHNTRYNVSRKSDQKFFLVVFLFLWHMATASQDDMYNAARVVSDGDAFEVSFA